MEFNSGFKGLNSEKRTESLLCWCRNRKYNSPNPKMNRILPDNFITCLRNICFWFIVPHIFGWEVSSWQCVLMQSQHRPVIMVAGFTGGAWLCTRESEQATASGKKFRDG